MHNQKKMIIKIKKKKQKQENNNIFEHLGSGSKSTNQHPKKIRT